MRLAELGMSAQQIHDEGGLRAVLKKHKVGKIRPNTWSATIIGSSLYQRVGVACVYRLRCQSTRMWL